MKKLFTASIAGYVWIAFTPAAVALLPPVILIQPQSQTKTVGDNVTFTVTATGDAPLVYQWKKNGSNISGATASSYTINSVVTANAANSPGYTVVITNNSGSATSGAATLTVNKVNQTITFGALSGKTYGNASQRRGVLERRQSRGRSD